MTIVDSIILGVVEGITEYLPVSSTGHLVVTRYFLGLENTDAAKAFDVCIQAGAIIAVLGLYFKYVKSMLMGLMSKEPQSFKTIASNIWNYSKWQQMSKDPQGYRLLVNVLLGFIPAVVIGLSFDDLIKEYLFENWPIAIAWFFGGIGILIYSRYRDRAQKGSTGKSIHDLTPKQALCIGFIQCIAMWPGTSRSLMTMIGGMCMGLSIVAAVEFSFLLGLITLSAAACHDAYKHGAEMLAQFDLSALLIGTLFAWISAVIAIKWMISYLQKHSFAVFGWYRIAIGVALAVLIYYTPL